uniref:UDP-glucuronosyltransferase 2B33 n=1 Tax=Lygus hesperus TaxID=30085 RepID=A0A0A9VZJ9_LYGHE
MQICYLLGTIALLLLTNQFVLAEVGKTASSKDGVVEPKSDPQVSKGVGATEKPSSKQKVEPSNLKPNLKPSENIRPSSDSGDREKSTIPTKEATASNTKENEAAQQIKTTETAEKTKKIPTPAVNNIKAQPEVTVEGPNVRTIKPSRILVMLPMSFYSHTQNYMPIFKELAKRGHHVTVVSPFPQNMTSSNWEEITVPNILSRLMAFLPDPDFSKQSFVDKIFGFMMIGVRAMNMTLQMKPVADLWNDDSREFDLVFVEAQFIQEPLVAFGHKFKAPVIALFPGFITPEVAYYTGNPLMTMTYVPNMFFPFSNSMSFLERGMNSAFNLFRIISYNLWTIPRMDELIRQYLPSKDLPYVGDMLFNMSFTFMDTHHVLSYPFPRVNNMRGFLGINTKPTSNLSQELQEYMDGGDDGVLFFTLGSHFQTSTLRPHILEALLGAFSKDTKQSIDEVG